MKTYQVTLMTQKSTKKVATKAEIIRRQNANNLSNKAQQENTRDNWEDTINQMFGEYFK